MGLYTPDSNSTKDALSGGNLPQAVRAAGHILEAWEIIVRQELFGI